VHISELSERHVEIPEQVVNVGDDISVKVIDIDLERRRISLSLKQASEGTIGEAVSFDPAQWGMDAQYDASGNYLYPEGFDAETQSWLPGYEEQQQAWERQYAEAHARFDAAQAKAAEEAAAAAAESPAAEEGASAASYSSSSTDDAGTLSSDEALAALRDQLHAEGQSDETSPVEEAPVEESLVEETPGEKAADS
jgi:small subunit ribosomal protein S1